MAPPNPPVNPPVTPPANPPANPSLAGVAADAASANQNISAAGNGLLQFAGNAATAQGAMVNLGSAALMVNGNLRTMASLQSLLSETAGFNPLINQSKELLQVIGETTGAKGLQDLATKLQADHKIKIDTAAIKDAKENVGQLQSIIETAIISSMQHRDSVETTFAAYQKIAASQGRLAEYQQKYGADQLAIFNKHAAALTELRAVSGYTTAQSEALLASITSIPFVLEKTADNAGKTESALKLLAMQAKHGNLDLSDLTGAINTGGKSFYNFDKASGDTMNRFIAGSIAASQAARLNFKDVSRTVEDLTASMGHLGDVSEGVQEIFYTVGRSIRDQGVSQAKTNEITTQYTKGILELTTSQKAYLSELMGGAGGMQGVFQIEEMMRKDPKEAMRKLQETITGTITSTTGGRLVTQEEAAGSQEAANVRASQMQMLQTTFGQLASSFGGAGRLLDALANPETMERRLDTGLEARTNVAAAQRQQMESGTFIGDARAQTLAAQAGAQAVAAAEAKEAIDRAIATERKATPGGVTTPATAVGEGRVTTQDMSQLVISSFDGMLKGLKDAFAPVIQSNTTLAQEMQRHYASTGGVAAAAPAVAATTPARPAVPGVPAPAAAAPTTPAGAAGAVPAAGAMAASAINFANPQVSITLNGVQLPSPTGATLTVTQ